MENQIKAIVWDWAGVFCSPGEPFSHPALSPTLNLTVDEMGTKTQGIQKEYYRDRISRQEFWNKIIKFFGLTNLTTKELSQAYLNSYRVYPEMLGLTAKLKMNYTTILLSNLTAEMMEDVIKRYQIKNYFHETIFSNEVGLMKPDPAIFKLALEYLALPPEQVLFIDDSETNVSAAAKLGFQTILFRNPKQCQIDLGRLGIIKEEI